MKITDPISDEIFNEIKQAAIEIWNTYDDTYGYASEKINYLNSFGNIKDNWGTIVGMFDRDNQQILLSKLGPDARNLVMRWL